MALFGNSAATLHKLDGGAHLDLVRGSVLASTPQLTRHEVHLEGAALRSEAGTGTNTQITFRRRAGTLAWGVHELANAPMPAVSPAKL